MSFVVLDPGLASQVVDLGRPGTRSLGVPVGGAADRSACTLGNALVGNPAHSAGLEICLKGPVLRAEGPVAGVLFGAPFSIASARQKLQVGITFTLQPGEEIHIGGTPQGMRAYLCVRSGFEAPEILNSLSSLSLLKPGGVLPCIPSRVHGRYYPQEVWTCVHETPVSLRAVEGLQADWFAAETFYDQVFTVSPAQNRMGLRLQGKSLELPNRELVSEPVCPGAVQVTKDGQCIVLGIDGQTIGGYPKIAQVIQADLDLLGQLRPGMPIRFQPVSLEEASTLFHNRQQNLREWGRRARLSLDGW